MTTLEAMSEADAIDAGTLRFSVESRLLRELGERLVKQPEVALVELIKNAYDADARTCDVLCDDASQISVVDDGHGMTLDEFRSGWMRIGTSSKENAPRSRTFQRTITGEKGIGRFAVRFLGTQLDLQSVAYDKGRSIKTILRARFDWPRFDSNSDIGQVSVPFTLHRAGPNSRVGTSLRITALRTDPSTIDLDAVRTATVSVVTPYLTLLRKARTQRLALKRATEPDPGFSLNIQPPAHGTLSGDVARAILDGAILRAVVTLEEGRVRLEVFQRAVSLPVLAIDDKYPNTIGTLYADIRFLPQRKGTFVGLPVDGRRAKTWVKEHSGIAVFDRSFRVLPYGTKSDDWLRLAADTARRSRETTSSLAAKHFPMDSLTRPSTQLNYMLRLPHPEQVVGVVQIEGQRSADHGKPKGLIAAADREGFVDNAAFKQLKDIVRGAVEAIASADRELQQNELRKQQAAELRELKAETRAAIREIEANPSIRASDKRRIVQQLIDTQTLAQRHEAISQERESSLEVMSLLGVVAGFMTHEFGVALDELEKCIRKLRDLAKSEDYFRPATEELAQHAANLREFVSYSQGYVKGATNRPARAYPVRPRVQQAIRVFGHYASQRGITIETEIDGSLMAPLVPVSLYNGILLNLFTNALKALTAKSGRGDRRIAIRSWNEEGWHRLAVSDTGPGIPPALRERIFDPLFTTTGGAVDPLGSGMGLGLTLVKRASESYGGRVEVVEPPGGFSTCMRVTLPLEEV